MKNTITNTTPIMKLKLLIIFLLVAAGIPMTAQVIWTNPITGFDPGATSPYTTGQTVAANITVSGIVRSGGLTFNAGDDRYNARDWATGTTLATTNNDYFEFTITPNAGYQIDFESFTYTGKRSTTGPQNFVFRSNLSAYATDIGVANETGTTIALSAATYQDRTAATTFRFYGWRSTAAGGTFSINDFTFRANVSPICTTMVTGMTITPASGPVGTEVTITAASGLSGATATFEGLAATVVSSSNTKLVVTIPSGAITGSLIVTNSVACPSNPIPYTIITEDRNGCGSGSLASDLFISEVADAGYGTLSYIEVTNNTGVSKNLSNYKIKFAQNANPYGSTQYSLGTTMLAHGSSVVIAIENTTSGGQCTTVGGDGSYASFIYTDAGFGLAFNSGGCDTVGLFYTPTSTSTPIDAFGQQGNASWMTPSGLVGTQGADFRRKSTVTVPRLPFALSDWDIIDFVDSAAGCATNDYSDIGKYDGYRTPPALTGSVFPSIVCATKSINIQVTGAPGIVAPPGIVYVWYYAVPGSASFVLVPNTAPYSGVLTGTLTISNIDGLDGYQYYCQIREDSSTCFTASNAYVIKEIPVSTYTTSGWVPSAPTSARKAIFEADYNTTSGNVEACRCEIKSTATVTIDGSYWPIPPIGPYTPTGTYIELQRNLENNGTLIIESNGSLIQVDDTAPVTGTGTTTVFRETTPYDQYDYTYWSSPVFEPTIGTTFPDMRTDHSYSWITSNFVDANGDGFDDAAPWAWNLEGPTAVMKKGVGYIVRASSTSGTWPRTSNGTFSGVLNNGIVSVPTSMSPNPADSNSLVGNPYASAISADDFIDLNTNIDGTLYFWTHVDNVSPSHPGPYLSNFSSDDYAVYTKMGGTGTRGAILHPTHPISGKTTAPTGKIASGQGFYVTMLAPTPIVFNNALRSKAHVNTDFFKTTGPEEKDRVWLNLYNEDKMFSQQLVGYADEATLGKDRGYDGPLSNAGNYVNFYSLIGNEPFKIQGRPTFNASDEVPLGYFSAVDDVFKIEIDSVEGQLRNVSHIYLQDRDLQVFHDLKQGPYLFVTQKGTFDNRFVIRYTNEILGNSGFEIAANDVLVVANDKIEVKSLKGNIQKIQVFDVLGRMIYTNPMVNQREFVIENIAKTQSALIVKVTLENQAEATKKIRF